MLAALLAAPVPAQETSPSASPPPPLAEPDIIVRGRRYGPLRADIEIAEEAFYQRFNDINSDDRFDIHCYNEKRYASNMRERRCQSNSWRELDAKIGQELVRGLLGFGGGGIQQYQSEQISMQQRLTDEMRRLILADEDLRDAVVRLANMQLDLAKLTGRFDNMTLEREVFGGSDGLPFGAQRSLEVKIGRDPWSHALTQPTFTIGRVSGEIRDLRLDCDGGDSRLDYQPDVDWTIPSGWSACILRVRAKRGTTFALYEF